MGKSTHAKSATASCGSSRMRNHDTTMEEKQKENLDKLYELREELELVAASDAEYAKYAVNFLESLDEAGYDVNIPEPGSLDPSPADEPDGPAAQYCPNCGEGLDAEDQFCRYCGEALRPGQKQQGGQ